MTRFDLTRRGALISAGAAALLAGTPLGALAQEPPYATGDVALGAEDAPVTIVEYASLTCPHCAAFHKEIWPDLKAQFVDTGKVRFVMREVYFDKYGLWAAMVARCGGESTYFPFVDVLMKTQRDWTKGEQQDIVANLRRVGKQGGLTDADLDLCLNDQDFARGLIDAYQTHAKEDGVRSTPTFFIQGEMFDKPRTIENFAAEIGKHL